MPHGGHNLLEPAVLSKPVLTGPHLFNFKDVVQLLTAKDALMVVEDSRILASQLIMLMGHPSMGVKIGARAFAVVSENRGALDKQAALIAQVVG